MNKCNKCKIEKELTEFYKDKGLYNNLPYVCKKCTNARIKKYRRTKKGLITNIYSQQKSSSKKRNHELPNYTKQELKEWMVSQPNFKTLYNNWVKSGYKKVFKPSCDRLNDYKSYALDNIQLVTWKQNNDKGYLDRKNGKNNKDSKAVLQFTKEGKFIKEHYSMRQAMRETGVNNNRISKCCNDIYKTAGAFIWKYK